MSLTIQQTIDKLVTYNNAGFPILSVYLSTAIPTTLNEQFKHLYYHTLSEFEQQTMQHDYLYVSSFFNNFKGIKREYDIAIFSGGDQLWELLYLPFHVPPAIKLDYRPYLQPLYRQLPYFLRFLIILADQHKAKIFTMHMGNMEEESEITNPDEMENMKEQIDRIHENHDKISQQNQSHLRHYYRLVSHKVDDFVRNRSVNAVIIGGHKHSMHQFEKYLSRSLQQKVTGEFISDINAPLNYIMIKAERVLQHRKLVASFISRPFEMSG